LVVSNTKIKYSNICRGMQLLNQLLIKRNLTTFSILLFLLVFGIVQWIKPKFIYNLDGSLREFGIGYMKKTVVPAWLVSIIIAILSYLAIFYMSTPRMFM